MATETDRTGLGPVEILLREKLAEKRALHASPPEQTDQPRGLTEALRAVGDAEVEQALRTYEEGGGALRYLEKDKWHLCDRMAMRRVLAQFAAGRLAQQKDTAP